MPGGTRGLRLGRISGVPVIAAPTSGLLILVVAVVFAPSFGSLVRSVGALIVVVLAFAIVLAGSVLLHEISHAVTAQRLGIPVGEIVITGWGGHTTLDRMPRPGAEALTAIAGPAANAVIGVAFYLLVLLGRAGAWPDELLAVLVAAAWANWFVAAFNMLPGLPLDGGQVLESLVWAITRSRYKGTMAAGWIGRIVAIGVGLWAIVLPLLRGRQPDLYQALWAILIGSYLWSGASQSMSQARHAVTLEGLDPLTLAHPAIGLPQDATLTQADEALAKHPGAVVVVADPQGAPVGVIEPETAAGVPAADRGHVQLLSVAVRLPEGAAVPASLRGQALAHALGQFARSTNWVLVGSDDGHLAGALRVTDVIAALR